VFFDTLEYREQHQELGLDPKCLRGGPIRYDDLAFVLARSLGDRNAGLPGPVRSPQGNRRVSGPRQGMGKASRRRIPGEPGPRDLPETSGDVGPNRQRDETPGARPRRFKNRPWGVRWGVPAVACFGRRRTGAGTGNGPSERGAREREYDKPGPQGPTCVATGERPPTSRHRPASV
jgi:hypothetical protein